MKKHSRPYYGYDARIDPTILNAVRNKYVDVSGLLIPNNDLPKNKNGMNRTQKPYRAYGIIVYFYIFASFFISIIIYR